MAKNIMISNEVYEKLKSIKESNPSMSYSDAIKSLEIKRKTAVDLKEALSKLRIRDDDKRVKKMLREGWGRWTKRYA